MAIAPTMVAQSSGPAIVQEVFITVVVDSSTPAWEELFSKYMGPLFKAAIHPSNAAKIPKVNSLNISCSHKADTWFSDPVFLMYRTLQPLPMHLPSSRTCISRVPRKLSVVLGVLYKGPLHEIFSTVVALL
jgi:hypothetical protein